MSDISQQNIQFLPGVGPKRAEMLKKELGIETYEDLIYYFPYKYIDRSKIYKIKEIVPGTSHIQLRGKIIELRKEGTKYKQRLICTFTDGSGYIELIWFKGIRWILESIQKNKEYIIFGKPVIFNRKISIAHPEIEEPNAYKAYIISPLQPLYNTTEKMKSGYLNSKALQKIMTSVFKEIKGKIYETLPAYLIKHLKLISIGEALFNIHFPQDNNILKLASYRLKFEELFFIQLNILRYKYTRKQTVNGLVFEKVGALFNSFYYDHLPYELTGAQKKVLKEIRKDTGSGKQMNRLLQGDVGSGKTIVALMSIFIALDNGYQTCIMAPTEILATQHFESIKELIEDLPLNVKLLTGSTKKRERDEIHAALVSGQLNLLIGTHALIEDNVIFSNLGLVIIDEQHRFGVAQRARLWKKNKFPPHVLVMTATPIPRTLAMTLYGDLDVSVIDELPPGRKPVKTYHYYDTKRLRLIGFMKEMIKDGRQIFVVFPLISESEKMDYNDLEDGYNAMKRDFPSPGYTVNCIHGRMKADEKEWTMQQFVNGKIDILVATTVIEVGVNIPNATVMIIESAERFGLSQLHQLRGRVGRGDKQSYCILMTSHKLTNEAKKRMETMVATNDGFEIAETDLKLRGPGDLEGTQQSGIPFNLKIAHLGKDGQILQHARNIASDVLSSDPMLNKQENNLLLKQLKKHQLSSINWSQIS